ncbi:MAG TPA: MurR/RpiR family transcriptional regulator [Thermotogota bacterium]|nr:MurR/RpiR family transcriptional regulator [Thermotogota bacterium]HRW92829.1 MurR/RpiR family transcriptional regulator [Thermotogota bacterium]
MPGENTLLKIETRKDSFTRTERVIANHVLDNHGKVIYMSLTELSDLLKVSEGSIVRFCQKLGFSGFHAFKIALATLESQEEKNLDHPFNPDDLEQLKHLVAHRNQTVIQETCEFIAESNLKACVDLLQKARKILIVGVGASGITAQDAFYKFMRIGLNCQTAADGHLQAMMAAQLGEGDVLMAFSQSGSTLEIVDIARIVKNNGGAVVAITGYERSPLARFSDFALLTPTRESPFESGALRSKVAQLYVLELLSTALYWKNREGGNKVIQATADAVSRWIY